MSKTVQTDVTPIETLFKLCDGTYRNEDVNIVVRYFINITKAIILKTNNLNWLTGEWREFEGEVEDVALDYIAHLFARDDGGVFIELKSYFDPIRDIPDSDLNSALERLIYSTVHQESIRVFGDRDPVGRIFYRSLRYILAKHPDWEKFKLPDGSQRIAVSGRENRPATELSIMKEFKITNFHSVGLTETLERGLITLLEKEKRSVPVKQLLNQIRLQLSDGTINTSVPGETGLEITMLYHLETTLREVNQSILEKYEKDNKLLANERAAFSRAVKKILEDFRVNQNGTSYYEYLSNELPSLKDSENYRTHYRKQFEYVAKVAKKTFSASVKSDFKLE
ncbi:MAG: hypothetical protein GXO90_02925 [FCB group bacterium]|nr:hypothetical protein [FCB group bacterium]